MRALFWHTLCANARHTWCVLEADRCRREDGQATHPHQEGGEVASPAGIRLWSPQTRQKCAEGNLSWALVFTTDYLAPLRHLKEKQTPRTSCDFRENPTGDEYHRCQGVSRAAGDTPTIWGERWCALCGDDRNRLCAGLTVGFLHKDSCYLAMLDSTKDSTKISLWVHLVIVGGGAAVRASLWSTLLDENSGLNEKGNQTHP